MRPDRHRAAHVGQRAGQVPAPQLVFGAVGVVGARRSCVAVTRIGGVLAQVAAALIIYQSNSRQVGCEGKPGGVFPVIETARF